ncbi:MAG: hypothetical protein PHT07_15160 [Paludibacter sp.]|nr:hypothetical protein [Paludibacter sp.]
MNKKQLLIATGGTALLGGAIYYFLHKAKQQNEFNELLLILEQSKAEAAGDLGYLNALKPGYESEPMGGVRITLYTTAKIEEIVDALNDAFKNKVLKLSGTDEEAIYSIYRKIESQKKMAQIATRYGIKYGTSLIDKFNSELNKNERTKLFNIIKTKPVVQFA